MIAEVIPIRKLPKSMSLFDYGIPKKLEKIVKPGQLVKIPFKQGLILGLIHNLKTTSKFKKIKEIIEIKDEMPFLPKEYLNLMNWFSEHYHYSLSSTLNLFLPKIPKKSSKAGHLNNLEFSDKKNENNTKINKISEQVYCSPKKKYLLFPYNQEYKNQLFFNLIKKNIQEKTQILILFPQIEKLKQFISTLPKEIEEKTAIITNEIFNKKNYYYNLWQQIKNNEKQVILGTRSAIFSPITNLKTLVIDFAHNDDFKQSDMTPRYQTITIAKKLQKLTNCQLILSSTSPRIEDYYLAKQEKYQQITLGEKIDYKSLRVIDLKDERRREFTYLSKKLITETTKALEKKQKVILIVNKKGLAGSLMCLDCKHIINCPDCNLPLTLDNTNQLNCYHCKKTKNILLKCPECNGANMKTCGIGLDQIKIEINKIFNNNPNIIISTIQDFSEKTWKNIGLLGLIYVDSLIHLTDFNSNFRLYKTILELSYQAKHFNKNVKIIIQTSFIENFVFNNLLTPYNSFFTQEITSRKLFNYPPFKTLIKLFCQDELEIGAKQEAQKIYKILKKTNQADNLEISEPYPTYRKKIRNKYRYQISLKLNKNTKTEKEIFKILPEKWQIDKEPNNLL